MPHFNLVYSQFEKICRLNAVMVPFPSEKSPGAVAAAISRQCLPGPFKVNFLYSCKSTVNLKPVVNDLRVSEIDHDY